MSQVHLINVVIKQVFNVVIKKVLSLLMMNTCIDMQYVQVLHLQQINNSSQNNIYLLSLK